MTALQKNGHRLSDVAIFLCFAVQLPFLFGLWATLLPIPIMGCLSAQSASHVVVVILGAPLFARLFKD